jgi:hypothetical protein
MQFSPFFKTDMKPINIFAKLTKIYSINKLEVMEKRHLTLRSLKFIKKIFKN